ncbi:MAG TPA: hypothetical protein PK096_00510 [Candidatus Saccharibacteria bacterium]|nr:hypothetical protein [Candidatus Saccharibacteria bacterium]HRK93836.1 hypothetical protein [Candidatus Saccharibacteria bacterium]
MRITWKDGVTTLATAGIVLLEAAHFYEWGWALVDEVRWVIFGIAALLAISYVFGYVFDGTRSTAWNWVAALVAVVAVVTATLGLIYAASGYAAVLMFTSVAFWLASLVAHLTIHYPTTHGHTYA